MNRQEIISEDVQRERGGQIGFLFGKARSQSRESAHSRSKGQIRSFDVCRRTQFHVGPTTNRFAFDRFQVTRTIRLSATLHFPVVFDFLAVVNISAENRFDGRLINSPTIACELESSVNSLFQ